MSKELKALDFLFDFIKSESEEELYKNYYNEIKNALKALEIIKEKEVVVSLLIWSNTLDQYNNNTFIVFSKLTQEEYDLLKEVLSWIF